MSGCPFLTEEANQISLRVYFNSPVPLELPDQHTGFNLEIGNIKDTHLPVSVSLGALFVSAQL